MRFSMICLLGVLFASTSFAGPCDGTDASKKEVDACNAANRFRLENGLSALTLNTKLNQVARAHAKDMVARGYFEHETPEGITPSQRLDRSGVANQMNGENIAQGQETGVEVVEGWKNSPGHRANLLTPDWNQHGMGEFQNTWVHVFIQN